LKELVEEEESAGEEILKTHDVLVLPRAAEELGNEKMEVL